MMGANIARWFSQNRAFAGAILMFLVLYIFYNFQHPAGFSSRVLVGNSNEAVGIGFVAMAQAVPVLVGGLDLSVGAVMTMTSCLASILVDGTPLQIFFGIIATLGLGAAFGFMNGMIVVYGRIQPIIATLATGALAIGIALLLRPKPGGNVDGDLNWALTNSIWDFVDTYFDASNFDEDKWWFIAGIPVPLIVLFGVAFAVWLPFKKSVTGRTIYAIGSAEGSAYMSGLPINRAKIAAFTLGGFFAACGGLFIAIQTSSGNADIQQAGAYTLNSIAAVVIGGCSLMGGIGGAIGALIGALILRVISYLFRLEFSLFGFDLSVDPLLQPLMEGLVLLIAVSIGALRTLRVKNKLELFR